MPDYCAAQAQAQARAQTRVSPADAGLLAAPEAADALARREFFAFASVNRTCELGTTRATGHEYQHVLEVLERATRPAEVPAPPAPEAPTEKDA